MGYWKDTVLPTLKKTFETKNSIKKVAAAEATKTFDEAKEGYGKEFDEKKEELQPKVLELYEASSPELKALIKAPKSAGLKKYSPQVEKFLEDLSTLEFPGAKPVKEAVTTIGAGYLRGPITFIFEKVATFIPVEEKKVEEAAPAAEAAAEPEAEKTAEEATSGTTKDKEIVIEEEKKEEEVVAAAVEATEPAAAEPAKAEEVTPVVEPAKP